MDCPRRGGLPKGTTQWPKLTDQDVRATIASAWRKIVAANTAPNTPSAKTKAAYSLGEGAWKGTIDGELNGRAAEYIKNKWDCGKGEKNAPQKKRDLLAQLNEA